MCEPSANALHSDHPCILLLTETVSTQAEVENVIEMPKKDSIVDNGQTEGTCVIKPR